jgi:hypothetical protein
MELLHLTESALTWLQCRTAQSMSPDKSFVNITLYRVELSTVL